MRALFGNLSGMFGPFLVTIFGTLNLRVFTRFGALAENIKSCGHRQSGNDGTSFSYAQPPPRLRSLRCALAAHACSKLTRQRSVVEGRECKLEAEQLKLLCHFNLVSDCRKKVGESCHPDPTPYPLYPHACVPLAVASVKVMCRKEGGLFAASSAGRVCRLSVFAFTVVFMWCSSS